MALFAAAEYLHTKYRDFGLEPPALHVVLGSALSDALDHVSRSQAWSEAGRIPFAEIPGLPAPTVVGHGGIYRYFTHPRSGKAVAFQVGRLHGYEGLSPKQVVQTVLPAFVAGTKRFLLTNSAGSLTLDFPVGSVMLISDHVNLTGQNPLAGPNPTRPDGSALGPRFPDMTEAYDPGFRASLRGLLSAQGLVVNEGIYLGLLGPSFETPAEVATFSRWGLHAVGMSTVWEAIALRHAGATIGGISLISNAGCGLAGKQILSHEAVLEESRKSAQAIVAGLFAYAEREYEAHD